MKLASPRALRSKTSLVGWRLRQQRWLTLWLGLLSTLLMLTVSAAATCNFLLKWGTTGMGAASSLRLEPLRSIARATFMFQIHLPACRSSTPAAISSCSSASRAMCPAGSLVLIKWRRTRRAMFIRLTYSPTGYRSSVQAAHFY